MVLPDILVEMMLEAGRINSYIARESNSDCPNLSLNASQRMSAFEGWAVWGLPS